MLSSWASDGGSVSPSMSDVREGVRVATLEIYVDPVVHEHATTGITG